MRGKVAKQKQGTCPGSSRVLVSLIRTPPPGWSQPHPLTYLLARSMVWTVWEGHSWDVLVEGGCVPGPVGGGRERPFVFEKVPLGTSKAVVGQTRRSVPPRGFS